MSRLPPGALGLGWRPETARMIERSQALGFCEVIAENIHLDAPPRALLGLRDRGVSILVHGVSLGLGDAALPSNERLDHLALVAELFDAPLISEHIAFVRSGGHEAGHLLPVERSEASLEILCENIKQAQAHLPRPLALENIAALVEWPSDTMDEASFIGGLVERTGSGLLFDAANWWANAFNHAWDPVEAFERLPHKAFAYAHIAGGTMRAGMLVDTHAHPLRPEALKLLETVLHHCPQLPVLLERDDRFTTAHELEHELIAIRNAYPQQEQKHAVA